MDGLLPTVPPLEAPPVSSYPRYIYLIRHGEKANAFSAPDPSGWKKAHKGPLRFDPPLTPVGREQAKDTARRLAEPTLAFAPHPTMKSLPSIVRQPSTERIEPTSSSSSPPTTIAGTGTIDQKTSDAIGLSVSSSLPSGNGTSSQKESKEAKRARIKAEQQRKKEKAKTLKYDQRNAKRAIKQMKEGVDHPIHHIFSSPFTRAVETAVPLAQMLHLPVRLEWGFSENIERGAVGENEIPAIPTPEEHKAKYPFIDTAYVSAFRRQDLRKGGEERADVVRRTKFALERILANTTGNIAIFAHGGPVEKVTSALVADKTFEPSFCGISRIRMDAPRVYHLEVQASNVHVQQKFSFCRKICLCRPKCSRYRIDDNAPPTPTATSSAAEASSSPSPTPAIVLTGSSATVNESKIASPTSSASSVSVSVDPAGASSPSSSSSAVSSAPPSSASVSSSVEVSAASPATSLAPSSEPTLSALPIAAS